jgi:hypothetical protein
MGESEEGWAKLLVDRLTDWKMLVFYIVIIGAVLHKLDVGIFGSLSDEAVRIIHAVKGR